MRVRPSADGVRLTLPQPVRELIAHTVGQVVDLLQAPSADDPALHRLLPDAYAQDPQAAQEFRRLTQDDLVERKRADATVVLATVFAPALDAEQAECWLRSLTDVRLVLAQRLGITEDGEAERLMAGADEETRPVLLVLQHLGWVQELLIEALEAGGF